MNTSEPFGLPRGTVRGVLTIALVAIVAVSLFVPVLPDARETLSGLLALAVMAVKDYFGYRAEANAADRPPVAAPSQNG